METTVVAYEEIDEFVDKRSNLFFEGWDVIVLTKNPGAWARKDGIQKNGAWFSQRRISPNASGKWVFNKKDVNGNSR